jgi:hypothetical protein
VVHEFSAYVGNSEGFCSCSCLQMLVVHAPPSAAALPLTPRQRECHCRHDRQTPEEPTARPCCRRRHALPRCNGAAPPGNGDACSRRPPKLSLPLWRADSSCHCRACPIRHTRVIKLLVSEAFPCLDHFKAVGTLVTEAITRTAQGEITHPARPVNNIDRLLCFCPLMVFIHLYLLMD